MTYHGLFIGINSYRDPNIPQLCFARNDAEDMYLTFNSLINKNLRFLLDEDATCDNIRKNLRELAKEASEDDIFIMFFAGHGASEQELSAKSKRIARYLVPHDASKSELDLSALSLVEDINKFFRIIPCKNVIFFVDSCYSGQAGGRTFPPQRTPRADATGPSWQQISGRGRIVLTACDDVEVAGEDERLRHGIFTHSLLSVLHGLQLAKNKKEITIEELSNV